MSIENKGGVELIHSVIMDVMNVEQAKIAEEAGASAVMALGMLCIPNSMAIADDQSESPPTSDAMVVSHEWFVLPPGSVIRANCSPTPV